MAGMVSLSFPSLPIQQESTSPSPCSRICRICHLSESIEADLKSYYIPSSSGLSSVSSKCYTTTFGRLWPFPANSVNAEEFISPCACRGSMRYVHRSCLNEWRLSSPRADSFYRCEQCFLEYKICRSPFMGIFSHRGLIRSISSFAFILIFLSTATVLRMSGEFIDELLSPMDDDVNYWSLMLVDDMVCSLPVMVNSNSSRKSVENREGTPSNFPRPLPTKTLQTGKNEHEEESGESFVGVDYYVSLLLQDYCYYSLAVVVLSLLYYIFRAPSLNMAFNLAFSLWRVQRYSYTIDVAFLGICALYGTLKLYYALNGAVIDTLEKFMKGRFLDLEDFEGDKPLPICK